MNFEIKPLHPNSKKKLKRDRKKNEIHPLNPMNKAQVTISVSLLFFISVIIFLSIGILHTIKDINFSVLLRLAGSGLAKDDFGHTNFLLLGHGGANHSGGDLLDTIMLVSLDQKNHLVTMLSLPRDLYLEDKKYGGSRINTIYYNARNDLQSSTEALNYLSQKIQELTGEEIHYWFKVDFKGFKEFIDAIGGIDVYVKNSIYDPFYPKDGTTLYEPFSITKGYHHLNGENALKYARSRKTTSDFDRAERQQEIINAIKDKTLSSNIIFNRARVEEIFAVLKNNIETNISIQEILTLGSFAVDIKREGITHRLLHNDPSKCGGFLYTPDSSYFGGAYVLLAGGKKQGFDHIKKYADLIFQDPRFNQTPSDIHILNGTKRAGVAGELMTMLTRYCFTINRFGNARNQNITETTYYYQPGKPRPAIIDYLQTLIPGKESSQVPEEYLNLGYGSAVLLEIGSDFTSSPKYLHDPNFNLPLITPLNINPSPSTSTPLTNETAKTPPANPTENANQTE